MPASLLGRCRLRRVAQPSHAVAPEQILRATPMSAWNCLVFLPVRNESNASSMIGSPIFGEGPLLAQSRPSLSRYGSGADPKLGVRRSGASPSDDPDWSHKM